MGEVVKVTGAGPELGAWNPANALTLYTTKEEFPVWRGGIFVDRDRQPDSQNLEYKYIILPHHQEKREFKPENALWENFEGNRTVSLM